MSSIILLSGGMDSLVSYRLFYPRSLPVFIQTGSRYEQHDLQRARAQAPRLLVLKAPPLRERADGVVPHRNAYLLALAANEFGAREIVVSAPRGEIIWDQQPAFHRAMEKVLQGVRIANPLRKLTKTQAVELWLQHFPPSELRYTRSCYSAENGQCGACPACVKRWIALKNNSIKEDYAADPRIAAQRIVQQLTLGGKIAGIARYGIRPAWEAYKAVG